MAIEVRSIDGRRLKPHDGASEVFVCRDCGEQIDPVGGSYPGYTQQQCDDGVCPLCGGNDTGWLFDED